MENLVGLGLAFDAPLMLLGLIFMDESVEEEKQKQTEGTSVCFGVAAIALFSVAIVLGIFLCATHHLLTTGELLVLDLSRIPNH